MKKLIYIAAIAGLSLASCSKDPDPVSTLVTVSYPVITLNGDAIVSTGIGSGAYVDPGATGLDDVTGQTSTLTPVFNNVDLTTAGFYSVKYSMKNSNGYVSVATRLVLVTSADPNIDISGQYHRVSNGQTVTVTKRGPGLFTTDNVGGVAGNPAFIFDVYFGMVNDTEIVVPVQPSGLGGDIYCDVTGFTISPADTSFSWVVHGSGFGTANRVFVHD